MTAPPQPPTGSEATPAAGTGAGSYGRAGIMITALKRRGAERFTGRLHLDGEPGGTVIMHNGGIVGATTPATPGPEPMLLRSGLVDEAEWSKVFAAAAPYGRLPAELVERGLLGTAGVQVLTRKAVADAIFAIALCGVRTCTAEPAGPDDPQPLLPVLPPLDVDRVIRESERRLEIAAGWEEIGLTVRSRPIRSPAATGVPADPARAQLLERVNGRRTPRDIAFALGRGLFTVMNDLVLLAQDGLITPAASTPATTVAVTPVTPVVVVAEPLGPLGLPLRRRGSRINKVLPWKGER